VPFLILSTEVFADTPGPPAAGGSPVSGGGTPAPDQAEFFELKIFLSKISLKLVNNVIQTTLTCPAI
jgi:hypothetical protein